MMLLRLLLLLLLWLLLCLQWMLLLLRLCLLLLRRLQQLLLVHHFTARHKGQLLVNPPTRFIQSR